MSQASPAATDSTRAIATENWRVGQLALVALGAAVLLAWVASDVGSSAALPFSSAGLANIATVLAPLVLVAAFVERAVEVVISAWRDHGKGERRRALERATGDSVHFARRELHRYRMQTHRFSFLVSLTLSLFAGLVGVRAVAPLMEPGAVQALPTLHALWLFRFDVVITTLLLAGGANGIHSVVTTITTFLDTTRTRTADAATGGTRTSGGTGSNAGA